MKDLGIVERITYYENEVANLRHNFSPYEGETSKEVSEHFAIEAMSQVFTRCTVSIGFHTAVKSIRRRLDGTVQAIPTDSNPERDFYVDIDSPFDPIH